MLFRSLGLNQGLTHSIALSVTDHFESSSYIWLVHRHGSDGGEIDDVGRRDAMASRGGSIDWTHRGENLRFWRSTLRAEDGRVRTRRQAAAKLILS